MTYDERLGLMIEDWREWWGIEGMPFGIVQLANFLAPKEVPTNAPWPNLRESQRRLALSDPNIGLVVSIDVGEIDDIHPRDKFTVGRRLARWALADVYELIDLRGGPEILSATQGDSSVILKFSSTGTGLHSMDRHVLGGFTVSDTETDPAHLEDEATNFYDVESEITSETEVTLIIPEGNAPKRVRYGWQNNPVKANLSNKERLPASPFEIVITP